MDKLEFVICSNVNGDKDDCKETECHSCRFRLPGLKEAAKDVRSLFQPKPDDVEYHLNCSKCDALFWSKEAFPEPQICPECSKLKPDSSRLLSDEEISKFHWIYISPASIDTTKELLKAQRDLTASECDEDKARADERAKCDEEKAEFGLSVHESARAMTFKEVGEWLEKRAELHCVRYSERLIWVESLIEALKEGEMPG